MNKIIKMMLILVLTLTVAGCKNEEKDTTITLAAAASLQTAFENELIPLFNEQYPHILIEGTYGGSGDLQIQIENGLNADVFFSAATKQMDTLEEKDYINVDTRVDLLENKLVLIVPNNSTLDIASFKDVLKADSIVIGNPDSVPAGQYSKEVFTNLNIFNKVLKRASLAKDVTEVLNQVAEGSGDVGVVYATDAKKLEDKVKIVYEATDNELQTPVIYSVASLNNSQHSISAKKFIDFLKSNDAKEIFEKYGFTIN